MSRSQNGKWLWILPRPHSSEGRWAVILAVLSVPLMLMWSFWPLGAWPSFACGFAGGVLALVAIVSRKERNWLVYLAVLPLLQVLVFFVGELLIPH